ncbi:hypothetical protein EV715DRAFT_288601 [Schizophyllum commune]
MAGAPLTSSPVLPPASDSPSVATITTITSPSTKLSTTTAPLTLQTPAQITALALVPRELGYEADMLVAGSADGTLRLYDLARGRVLRAVRGLGEEKKGEKERGEGKRKVEEGKGKGKEGKGKVEEGEVKVEEGKPREEGKSLSVWVACGRKVLHFALPLNSNAPLLLNASDATAAVDVCEEDEDDAVNELALHPRGSHLAFCTDAGAVGVLDLESKDEKMRIRRLKGRHANLASTLHFVPHRPRELVSGGYDCALLLHDWEMGSVLGRGDVDATANTDDASVSQGVSLSPPFVICSAMSSTGVLVAGLADGRVWVGVGGERETKDKKPTSKAKKRTKKWEGLDERGVLSDRVAEGPVVGV